jgi:hypothetical protein
VRPRKSSGAGRKQSCWSSSKLPPAQIAADEARVLLLDRGRRAQRTGKHQVAKAGGERGDPLLDALGDGVVRQVRPLRHVRVDVERVLAGRRARRVVQRLLADDHRRDIGNPSLPRLLWRPEERLERVAEMDDTGRARIRTGPRHETGERVVGLDVDVHIHYSLEQMDGRTQVTRWHVMDITMPILLRPLRRLILRSFDHEIVRTMRELKEYAEAHRDAAAG